MAGLLLALPATAGASQHEARILLDLDNDPGTGCLVSTVAGPFDGVEQVLITTLETTSPPAAGTVTDLAVSDCVDPASDTFGPPTSFDGGWPVGIDNGVGGLDVVETYLPLVSLAVPGPSVVRLGVVVTDELGGEQALLTRGGSPAGAPILLDLRSVVEVPTLSDGALLVLALLLAGASTLLLGRRGATAALLVILLLGAVAVWAAGTLDGLTDDWSAGDLLTSNGIALFGQQVGADLCFRVDLELLFNTAPTAEPQTVTTDEDTPVAILLTGSDTEGDPLTFSIVPGGGPENGTLTGTAPNLTYTPAADLEGTDSFDFQVMDPSGATGTATVSIRITGVNDPPVAEDDAYETPEDEQLLAGSVLGDNGSGADADPEGDPLTVEQTPVTPPANGAVVLDGDGTFTYTPNPDFNGVDSFEYRVDDGNGGTDIATVTITVTAVDDPPVVTATIPVGDFPFGVAVSPDGNRAYVTNAFENTVSVIDTATNTVIDTITVGNLPLDVAVRPDGGRAYVANAIDGIVSVIDTTTNVVLSGISVGAGPFTVAVGPDGSRAYVANLDDDTMSVIDTSSGTVNSTITVSDRPAGVAILPDGSVVYVTSITADLVSVTDTATNTVIDTITVGDGPLAVAVHPVSSRAYVANSSDDTVSVVDTTTHTVIDTITVGDAPSGVAVSTTRPFAYVTNASDDTVSVIDTATNNLVATIAVGDGPNRVAVHPEGNRVYVANTNDDTVSVVVDVD